MLLLPNFHKCPIYFLAAFPLPWKFPREEIQGTISTTTIYVPLGFILVFIFILGFPFYIYKWRTRHLASTTTTSTDFEATLLDSPKLLYSEAKLQRHLGSAACSICLADYEETDVLRLLPECSHLFHLKCVDPWLRLKHTCPICRNSPMGTSQVTPVAEAATRRILTYDMMQN
ncbi:hypothetical protein Vadar_014371 [Vaccinium darrowii]|uniref:Uncharacterized protein n=1 Tax=Vaccinium darrowii TaxID=229202 RepID=A0ACB7XHF2_9ERIC|nr:hypothetical protein Vadar_014371 [Vaccinium darrowii]